MVALRFPVSSRAWCEFRSALWAGRHYWIGRVTGIAVSRRGSDSVHADGLADLLAAAPKRATSQAPCDSGPRPPSRPGSRRQRRRSPLRGRGGRWCRAESRVRADCRSQGRSAALIPCHRNTRLPSVATRPGQDARPNPWVGAGRLPEPVDKFHLPAWLAARTFLRPGAWGHTGLASGTTRGGALVAVAGR